jgi:menaquinone-dependent protoporphyrinogen oxidase
VKKHILVAYDTLDGSTKEVAEHIGKEVIHTGNTMQVHRVSDKIDVANYDAFIVGSPIIYENWTADSIKFLTDNQSVLCRRPVALFITCLAAAAWRGPKGQERALCAYMNPIPQKFCDMKVVATGQFGGVLDYSCYNAEVTANMQKFMSMKGGPLSGRHDYREWDVIASWTRAIIGKILEIQTEKPAS